jgi:aquaporin Z
MNPAVTLAFLRLGKIARHDAAAYVAAQFTGGLAGILIATAVLRQLPAHPAVNYVATIPGPGGSLVALLAEAAISFVMMAMVLAVSNHPRISRFTGVFAGTLVAIYILIEAPLSGMSMNPARSLGPAVLAGSLNSMWIYFAGPLAGMAAAAESVGRLRGRADVRCAKLVHFPGVPCIFRCGYAARIEEAA